MLKTVTFIYTDNKIPKSPNYIKIVFNGPP